MWNSIYTSWEEIQYKSLILFPFLSPAILSDNSPIISFNSVFEGFLTLTLRICLGVLVGDYVFFFWIIPKKLTKHSQQFCSRFLHTLVNAENWLIPSLRSHCEAKVTQNRVFGHIWCPFRTVFFFFFQIWSYCCFYSSHSENSSKWFGNSCWLTC